MLYRKRANVLLLLLVVVTGCTGEKEEKRVVALVSKDEIYGPLRGLKLFEQVTLDREVHTLVWPNGADFDPATLHDWPENVEESILAHAWDKQFEQDVTAGRLNSLADEALKDLREGRCTEF